MLKSRVVAAAVFSCGLLLGAQTDARAEVGIRGIAFCNSGEEIWIDVGPYFYSSAEAKIAFDNRMYSACTYSGGLSFFTRNFYTAYTNACPIPYREEPRYREVPLYREAPPYPAEPLYWNY